MLDLNSQYSKNWNLLSWEKCRENIFRFKRRIFKAVKVGDIKKSMKLQKLLLRSSSSRLFAIRYVTQLSVKKKISGIDGKLSLSFNERFKLEKYLLTNLDNWNPQKLKKILVSSKTGSSFILRIPTISDRTWCCLVALAVEPAHEAVFSPRSFRMGDFFFLHQLQKIFFLNLGKFSFGIQKRVLIIEFLEHLEFFDTNKLLSMIICPRSIKIGLFRLLQLGFKPNFSSEFSSGDNFSCLLANVLLNGIENLHNGIRYGNKLLFFLRPRDNERFLLNKVNRFLSKFSISNFIYKISLHSVYSGFDFLDWHFRVFADGNLRCTPSFESYRLFLRRIKTIINNSNYGSKVKVSKLSPIIREWKNYNKFCDLENSRFSLFLIQKRTFKIFSKESKQDIYSVKRLLNRSLFSFQDFDEDIRDSLYYGHLFLKGESYLSNLLDVFFLNSSFCLHCGMNEFDLQELNK